MLPDTDLLRVVELTADLGVGISPRFRFGSGLLLGHRQVLTSAHAVAGAQAIKVTAHDKSSLWADVKTVLIGEPDAHGLDLAMFEVPGAPDLPHMPLAKVNRVAIVAFIHDCAAVGFPAFQEVKNKASGTERRVSVQVGGVIAPFSDVGEKLLSFDVTARPRPLPEGGITREESSEWQGMSGAGVLARDPANTDGELLLGVVAAHSPRRGESSITVLPLDRLFDPVTPPKDADKWWARLGVTDPNKLPLLPTPGTPQTVPQMAPERHVHTVERPEHEAIISQLLAECTNNQPVRRVVALHGPGGFGKTTLAIAVCHDKRVRQAFEHGTLWVTLGEKPENLVARIDELVYVLSGKQRPGFSALDTAQAELAKILADRKVLLVLDDAVKQAHIKPFLEGGPHCARLITTRDTAILPTDAAQIRVGPLKRSAAWALLSSDLPPGSARTLKREAALLPGQLGDWPLLLGLVNRTLQDRVKNSHESLPDALAFVNAGLIDAGPAAFDIDDPDQRDQAVAGTISLSLELLPSNQRARYFDLAVFSGDVDIPIATVSRLWKETGKMSGFTAEKLCQRLGQLSLLSDFDLAKRSIRLHDVLSAHLRKQTSDELPALHVTLLKTYAPARWADMPLDEPYLWAHLAHHLIGAGRLDELVATVKDLFYLARKAYVRGALAAEADVLAAQESANDDPAIATLQRTLANSAHLLMRASLADTIAILYSRLQHLDILRDSARGLASTMLRPFLAPWHSFPDLPHPALMRTLAPHATGAGRLVALRCAISGDARTIVGAFRNESDGQHDCVKVWDGRTGTERFSLEDHAHLRSCALSPDGLAIVSGADDGTLKVRRVESGTDVHTLRARVNQGSRPDAVNACAVSDAGIIVSASANGAVCTWQGTHQADPMCLTGRAREANCCAVSADGKVIVADPDGPALTVLVEAQRATEQFLLSGQAARVNDCAVSAKGDLIVSAAEDRTLRIWDVPSRSVRHVRDTGERLTRCAISADGAAVVAGSVKGTLSVWDARSGDRRLVLQASPANRVVDCDISADGHIVVAAARYSIAVWDARGETVPPVPAGYETRACAVAAGGAIVLTASYAAGLKLWNATTGDERATLAHPQMPNVVGCGISESGGIGVAADLRGAVKVWNLETMAVHSTVQVHAEKMPRCALSTDGALVVATTDDGTLLVWDVRQETERFRLADRTGVIQQCAISTDGASILSGTDQGALTVWDARDGHEIRRIVGPRRAISRCVFSPDGSTILSASTSQGALDLWDVSSGAHLYSLSGHASFVHGCAMNADGTRIASVSADGSLKIWSTEGVGCLATLRVDGELWDCAWFPDGAHLVAAGTRGLYFVQLMN